MMLKLRIALFGLLASLALTTPARAELKLMMFEQVGCTYCIMWHSELGEIYPKTQEGRAAPLVTQQLRDDLPQGVSIKSRPIFTPTFVLLRDGQEVWRLEGYPGEDFFWGLLAQELKTHPEWAAAGAEG